MHVLIPVFPGGRKKMTNMGRLTRSLHNLIRSHHSHFAWEVSSIAYNYIEKSRKITDRQGNDYGISRLTKTTSILRVRKSIPWWPDNQVVLAGKISAPAQLARQRRHWRVKFQIISKFQRALTTAARHSKTKTMAEKSEQDQIGANGFCANGNDMFKMLDDAKTSKWVSFLLIYDGEPFKRVILFSVVVV